MYNRLFKYLSENSILYEKQFGFQTSHNTEHAILLLVNQPYQLFDESQFTLGIFIDLSKAFDTVDHKILTKKLELYGIKGCNQGWLKVTYQIGSILKHMVTNNQIKKLLHAEFLRAQF